MLVENRPDSTSLQVKNVDVNNLRDRKGDI